MKNVIESTMKMLWKNLVFLIYILNRVTITDCVPKEKNLSTSIESSIHAKRENLEQKHHIDYLVNKDLYRKWPEVHQNPKHDCQRFLQKIFPRKKDFASVAYKIQKVILNYMKIRDGINNALTPKRVTALECKLSNPRWSRKYFYFIRSPESPECSLFLNRIGKRSSNFYIVEHVCEYMVYAYIRKQLKVLEENNTQKLSKKVRQQLLELSDEEIKIKHAEYEELHYKYCPVNPDLCKIWPEVQMISQNECQRFLRRILYRNPDLSSAISRVHQVLLHYKDIKDKNNGNPDPIEVNAIACKLPKPVRNRKYVYFIRAPSYPMCVFCIIHMMLITGEHFFIAEEVCDTSSHQTSLHNILGEFNKSFKFTKTIEMRGFPLTKELQAHENIHFKHYSSSQFNYEKWPELGEINIESHCQELIRNICPGIADTREIINLNAKSGYVELKYAINETIPCRTVMSLQCFMAERPPPNRFHFIRTPKPNCVYWITRKKSQYNSYFIAREFCKDDTDLIESCEIDFSADAGDADTLGYS